MLMLLVLLLLMTVMRRRGCEGEDEVLRDVHALHLRLRVHVVSEE